MHKAILIILIVFIATVLRLFDLGRLDVTPDELHYIQDAYRLFNRDPFMALRYHPFKHPEPSIGHPLLQQVLVAFCFKMFGASVYTSRLPVAFAGLIAIVSLLFLNKKLGGKVSLFGAFLLAIIPFSVRYNRNAHLDSLFTLFLSLVAIFSWRWLQRKNKLWLISIGIVSALAFSVKLDGFLALVIAIPMLIWEKKLYLSREFIRRKALELSYLLIPFMIVFLLLNDPAAYIDGIVHPSDPSYILTSRLSAFFNFYSFYTIPKSFYYLFSPVVLVVYIISIVYLATKGDKNVRRFLFIWTLALTPLFYVHRTSIGGTYGWLPMIVPMILTISYFISGLKRRFLYLLICLLLLSIIPFTFWYGLRMKALPYPDYPAVYNRIYKDDFYNRVIGSINKKAPKNAEIFLLPQSNYPIFALRPDLRWNYFYPKNSDILVVADTKDIKSLLNNFKLINTFSAVQDGETIVRYMYSNDSLR